MPKVSVVMAVYNGDAYLGDAIQSILSQSFTDFEFVIIDDGSTDKSADIIRSYDDSRIRLFQQENRGLPASLNRGIDLSRAEYIARMDADDISESVRLDRQIRYMDNNTNCVALGTWGLMIDQDGLPLQKMKMPLQRETIWQELQHGASPFIHGSIMFRKNAVLECGGYDDRMITAQDWHLWTKMYQVGKMTNLSDILYRHRLSPEAITTMTPQMGKLKRAVLEKYLETGKMTSENAESLRFLKKDLSQREKNALYHIRVGKALIEGNWEPLLARQHFWQSIRLMPYNYISWVNFALCFLPHSWVSVWKRWRIPDFSK